jgi:hypothetical protein
MSEAKNEIGKRKPTDSLPPMQIARIGTIAELAPTIPPLAAPVKSTLINMTIIDNKE